VITPLRCGVDTLEATFEGELPDGFVDDLNRRKQLAQLHDEPQEVMLNGEMFYVQPKGRGFYSLVLRNQDMDLLFGSAGLRYPMSAVFSSYGLARRGVDNLWSIAESIGAAADCFPYSISRIDVAIDFQGWVPTFEEMRSVVCKTDFHPVYPSVDNPQTFQFGKGDVVVRVYDKTKQAHDCDKSWWVFIWRLCSGFDQSLPVWRAEVQVRRPVLKELGLTSPAEVFERIDAIFDYGLRWASLRVPGSDSNLTRCEEHPAWETLRHFQMRSEPLSRVRQARRLASYQSLIPRMRSLIVSGALCLETEDFWTAAKVLTQDAYMSIEPLSARDARGMSAQDADLQAFQALLVARRRKLSGEF
jgi:hypothetical protein